MEELYIRFMTPVLPDDILNISWSNAGQEIPVQIRLKNGSILQFKTYAQKRERFQGLQCKRFG